LEFELELEQLDVRHALSKRVRSHQFSERAIGHRALETDVPVSWWQPV
jgi:hypothetical protein